MISREITCPGLPAHWVNAWLAAVGVTVLDPRIRLRWTTDGEPIAVFSATKIHPLNALLESWPSKKLLDDLPIAEHWNGNDPMRRKVSVETFIQRARGARGHPYSWTLSSTMTDLCVDKNGEVEHAPFDPAGPGSTKWLQHRLVKLQEHLDVSETRVRESLMGYAIRVKDNGLGFDQTRLGSSSDSTSTWVDPLVETLAFFGLKIFPVRGNGIDQRLDKNMKTGKRQRGWRTSSSDGNIRQFHWPVWRQYLDYAGIDALMDVWRPARKRTWEQLEVHAGWRSVQYTPVGSADTTRGFGSERL